MTTSHSGSSVHDPPLNPHLLTPYDHLPLDDIEPFSLEYLFWQQDALENGTDPDQGVSTQFKIL
ncbi:hypothetical protein Pst134EA_028236 [Puccinia striiformis f. sp. tritici]|uniref:hypothetical protein n=1 Tax=Puccinia striiformis f. sp. tritici TaxID=168172 RepID=UPI0020078B2C|nr:hypothetical protein Pst134EA_028236 [Puccinia striiformis f. sp. tritici]KAH9448948.1 hypothetical protein Pst134EA_028236 [Puccinia striiformis f. sp. tritici]